MNYSSNLQVDWLIDEFKKINSSNNAYSLRAFAGKLSVSPSFLSQVFQGKKSLSTKMRFQIYERLKFDQEKIEDIENIIKQYKNNVEEVKSFCDKLCKTKVHDHINKKSIDADKYLNMIEWYHDAVFHTLDKQNKHKTIDDIASELDIPEEKLLKAVKQLEENDLIEKKSNGTYSKRYDSYCYYGDVQSRKLEEIKRGFINNQQLIHDKIVERLDAGDSSHTHLTTTYINVPEDEVTSAFLMIELFIKDLEKLYAKETLKNEKLFCLNTQFLCLNKEH